MTAGSNVWVSLFKINDLPAKRIFGLDLLRAIAILLVLVDHSKFFFPVFRNGFEWLTICGFLGVELFFVLSGFLIGGILIRLYFEQPSFGFQTIFTFWKRRWFRTLPNYFLFLIVSVLLHQTLLLENNISPWPYFVFMQNLVYQIPSFFMESWSLSVEEWFYLLLPFLFILLKYLPMQPAFKQKALVGLVVFFILLFSIVRYLGTKQIPLSGWNLEIRQIVLFRLDTLGYGVLMAVIHHFYKTFFVQKKNVLFIIGCLMLAVSIGWYINLFYGSPGGFIAKNTLFSSVSFSFACVLPKVHALKKPSFALIGKAVTHLSLISYAAYLINYSLILLPFSSVYQPSGWFHAFAWWLFFWITTLLSATLVYKFYEKPMTGLRDKISFTKG